MTPAKVPPSTTVFCCLRLIKPPFKQSTTMRFQTTLLSLFLLALILASYANASAKKSKRKRKGKNKMVPILSDKSAGRGDDVTFPTLSVFNSEHKQLPHQWTRPTPCRLSSSRIRVFWCKVYPKGGRTLEEMSVSPLAGALGNTVKMGLLWEVVARLTGTPAWG